MRIVIAGGTGQIGQILTRGLEGRGHTVQILSRSATDPALKWDGRTDGPWMATLDGADAVINLTGRSVNCRYHWANLNEMMASRIDSVLAIGRAIRAARRPPAVWLQASTATIYAHTHGPAHDEATGHLGGNVPGTPAYWAYSVHIARCWELALDSVQTPTTRKVALRLGFTMSPDQDGIFDVLVWLAERGLGGPFCGGDQYISWIGDRDLVGAVDLLLHRDDLEGAVNLTAPEPIRNRSFMALLTRAVKAPVALPVARWMARLGAVWLQTDIELMEKSRRVVPQRLLDAGYVFESPTWADALPDLLARLRRRGDGGALAA